MNRLLSVLLAAFSIFLAQGKTFASPVTTINPGDTVSITATLNTTDPNENGEGEPIVVTANGGAVWVNPNYASPATFKYTAPVGSSGSTSIGYYIQGADGDETANFNSSINPPSSPKNQAQIDAWTREAFYVSLLGTGVGTMGSVGCLFAGPYASLCGGAAGAIAGLSGMAGIYLAKLAADPIDPNFTVIATPKNISLPADLNIGISLASDEAKAIALAAALLTSINRYQGAVAAGNQYWTVQQFAIVNNYSAQLNNLVNNLPADLQSFINQILALGVPQNLNISTSDVYQSEVNTFYSGLSPDAINIFDQLALSTADLQSANQILYVQDINALAGQYPKVLYSLADNLETTVPEPNTIYLFAIAMLALFGTRRARKDKHFTHFKESLSFSCIVDYF